MTNYYSSPIGLLQISASEKALQSIHFTENQNGTDQNQPNSVIRQTIAELSEYFKGDRKEFSVPLNPVGTNFQQSVWKVVQEIPYGQTKSYGELAESMGNLNKVRAVGRANGQNPIPILIPCHRVIGGNNQLVGYSGGIDRKKHLLKHEGAILL